MNLSEREWKEFYIEDLFNVSGTTTTKPEDLIAGGSVPRITCAATNNALDDVYQNEATEKGNVITIDSATIGYVSYQSKDFIATDHVEKLIPKSDFNYLIGLFIKVAIDNSVANKYVYGYKFSQKRIKRQIIKLPVNESGEPDYDFMETYISKLQATQYQKGTTYFKNKKDSLKYKKIKPLTEINWKAIPLNEIFKIYSGKRLEKYNMVAGTRPFIGSTDSNNGITNFVSNENVSIDKNVLGVNYNGNVVENFYHPYECIFSDDVKRLHLINHEDNPFVLLFFKTVILQQKKKYMYAYKFNEGRMKRQYIVVPVKDDDTPDYDYMEQYIKNLIIAKCEAYLNFERIKR